MATFDQLLLYAGQSGIANLYPQISACHHDDVCGANNLVHRLDRDHHFRSFYLGDDGGMTACGPDQRSGLSKVGCTTREGDGNKVGLDLAGGENIAPVLVGECWGAEPSTQYIDPLAVGEGATDLHPGEDTVSFDMQDLKLDPAIIQQQDVAAAYVVDQIRVVEADAILIARLVTWRRIKDKRSARGQGDAPCGKAGNTDFWSLQVGQRSSGETHWRQPSSVFPPCRPLSSQGPEWQ